MEILIPPLSASSLFSADSVILFENLDGGVNKSFKTFYMEDVFENRLCVPGNCQGG